MQPGLSGGHCAAASSAPMRKKSMNTEYEKALRSRDTKPDCKVLNFRLKFAGGVGYAWSPLRSIRRLVKLHSQHTIISDAAILERKNTLLCSCNFEPVTTLIVVISTI